MIREMIGLETLFVLIVMARDISFEIVEEVKKAKKESK